MLRDVTYAVRTLRKSPIFAITAAATLSLGIGASTAIFSVANAVLLRPLPYRDADRLVLALRDMPNRDVKDFPVSSSDFIDVRNGMTAVFEDVAGIESATRSLVIPREDGTSEQVRISGASPNLLRLLGARIAFGRDFEEADGQPQLPSSSIDSTATIPVQRPSAMAILSYEYWQHRYAGNRSIIGHPMSGGEIVVGVLAPGFELLLPPSMNLARAPDYWVASRLAYDNGQRIAGHLRMIGKLKKGVSLDQAQAVANVVAARLIAEFPVKKAAGYSIRLEPMQKYLAEEARAALLVLMGAVLLLLLIACANVANLLLVRTSLREHEMAVRSSLGGSVLRLLHQMLTEVVLLTALGSLLGVGLAWLGIHELLVLAPASPGLTNLPGFDSVGIDFPVLAFASIAGLAAATVVGLVPALRASRPNIIRVLRASGRTPGLSGTSSFCTIAVVAQVALSFLLLIGAGLMLRSFVALQRINPGYDPLNLLTFRLIGGRGGPEQRTATLRELNHRLSALAGVQAVTATTSLPLVGGTEVIRWGKEGDDPSTIAGAADYQFVLPGYFVALRTPLLAGRTFTEDDNAPGRKLVVIDQFFAEKLFPSESALGKRILVGVALKPELFEVIGVVAHQCYTSLAETGREQLYLTQGLLGGYAIGGYWAVRTPGDFATEVVRIRAEIANLDKSLLVSEMLPMETLVRRAQSKTRFSLLLLGLFATIAALLAGVGIYGVLATLVRQRTAELGVRMALGATPNNILSLIALHGLRLSAVGIGVGLVAALGITRVMSSMLFGIQANDPVTFTATAALFLLIAAFASWLPARRAAGLEPTAALRED